MSLTPEAFALKYGAASVNERALVQTHFNDLCALLAVPTPDLREERYLFEQSEDILDMVML